MQPDAPGIDDVKEADPPACGLDFSLRTRNAAMVVACALRTRMRIRIKGSACFLWYNIDDILVSSEVL